MERVKFGQSGRDEFVKAGYRSQGRDMKTDKMWFSKLKMNRQTQRPDRFIISALGKMRLPNL